MSTPPPVSVYMPAYNVGRYVRQAVKSILAQSFGDFEFIIIDDGSTDDTLVVLKELAARDKRIRLISRPNAGVSATANEAIGLATGEFLARMDGDDVSTPDRLEKQVAYLRANPDCVAVSGRVLLMDEDALPLYVMPDVQFGHDKIDAGFWRAGWSIVQGACTFRRDALLAVGGYRKHLSLHEDHDLFTRLAEIGKLENLPDVMLHYRRHFSSITFRETASSREVIAGILSEARSCRGMPAMRPNRPQPMASRRNDRMDVVALPALGMDEPQGPARGDGPQICVGRFSRSAVVSRFVEADVLCAARTMRMCHWSSKSRHSCLSESGEHAEQTHQ